MRPLLQYKACNPVTGHCGQHCSSSPVLTVGGSCATADALRMPARMHARPPARPPMFEAEQGWSQVFQHDVTPCHFAACPASSGLFHVCVAHGSKTGAPQPASYWRATQKGRAQKGHEVCKRNEMKADSQGMIHC